MGRVFETTPSEVLWLIFPSVTANHISTASLLAPAVSVPRARPFSPTPALASYDVALCDRACPFCDKVFNTGKPESSRKALAKHVNDHLPDPTNARFKSWLEAANRAWCPGCQLSYARRQAHHCEGPRAVAPIVSLEAARLAAEDISVEDFKAEGDFVSSTCLLPSLMDIFSTSIPTVKRIPQKCRVTVAKAYTHETLLHSWID